MAFLTLIKPLVTASTAFIKKQRQWWDCCLLCVGVLKQTWSSICLWRTVDHGAAGKTGQNHGCHDLVHLYWLWAAEAGDNIQEMTWVCKSDQIHARPVTRCATPLTCTMPLQCCWGALWVPQPSRLSPAQPLSAALTICSCDAHSPRMLSQPGHSSVHIPLDRNNNTIAVVPCSGSSPSFSKSTGADIHTYSV